MSRKHLLMLIGVLGLLMESKISGAQQTPPSPYTSPVNYVRTWDATAPEVNPNTLTTRPLKDVKQSTVYLDGLGRPVQSVVKQGSLETATGTVADLVSPVVYDNQGREAIKYLSFAANSTGGNTSVTDGGFKTNAFQQQVDFYNNQLNGQTGETNLGANSLNWAYSKTNFESSPLNRPTETYAPGANWVGTEADPVPAYRHSVSVKYWNNTTTDDVKIWDVTNNAGAFGSYAVATATSGGVYPAGTLTKTISIDEHNQQIIEFKDKEGKVILKKVQLSFGVADDGTGRNYSGWLSTYYIYDDLGNLRCVIQPEGVKRMSLDGWLLTGTLLNEQCFRYEYDARNRMVMKKVPGAGEVYMVYDARDRLVMTQDANMRAQGKWMVTKYDALNRPVETGLWNNATAFATHLSNAYSSATYPLTSSGYETLTTTHYDDYSGLPAGLSAYLTNWNTHFSNTDNNNWPYPQLPQQSNATKGMVTWTQTKVLGTSTFLNTVIYYDEKGRAIQTQSTNISGGTDVTTTQYSWAGQQLVTVQKQEKQGGGAQTTVTVTQLTYDDLGRLAKTEKKVSNTLVNGGAMPTYKTIATNKYDKLGQLKEKKLAPDHNSGAGLETLNYDYNIRGWMLGMNRDYARDVTTSNYFGFDLGYDKMNNNLIGGQTYLYPQFNGNIEGMVWKSKGDGEKRKYDFVYDAANRLMRADFTQYTGGAFNQTAGVNFNFRVGSGPLPVNAYDDNGNIKRMQIWGLKVTGSVQIDNSKYTYYTGSNRLKSVTDFNNDALTKLGDFRTAATHPQAASKAALISSSPQSSFDAITDYSYDDNGNLVTDNNKAISSITYNHLNLPSVITVAGKGTISYTYDAAGNKIEKTTTDITVTPNKITTTLYMGGAVYENNVLQFLGQEEGRIRFKPAAGSIAASLQYDYMLKDHLGNVRMVLTEEQQQDKYPVASLEDAKLATEDDYYTIQTANIVAASTVTGLPAYTNDNGIGNNPSDPSFEAANSQKLYKINGNDANKTGLGITLKVMAGDRIDIFGKSYYFQAGSGTSTTTPNAMVLEILSGMLGGTTGSTAGAAHGGVSATQLNALPNTTGGIYNVLNQQASSTPADPPPPLAFINYIFFDEQFKFVEGGFSRAGTQNQLKDHYAELQNKVAQKNGYVYIYVSNETAVNMFFDNLQVVHTRGPILEETHYYPFGLTMSGISSKSAGILRNKIGITGKEIQDKEFSDGSGLELYDFDARMYDHQTGHFPTIDPKASKFPSLSPYVYVANNPINCIDPDGMEWVQVNGRVLWDDRVTNQETATQYYGESSKYRAPGYEWENKSQGCIKLGKDRNLTINGEAVMGLNATPAVVGAAIMEGGFETFIKYFEAFGVDYFFNAANRNFDDNASGFMGSVLDNYLGARDATRLSQMTHSWVDAGTGWTEEKNRLEHQIGMFLMAEKYGSSLALKIGKLNEYRGFWFNDRRSGNMWNALMGRGNTAFEWKDLNHNYEGIAKWEKYHGYDIEKRDKNLPGYNEGFYSEFNIFK